MRNSCSDGVPSTAPKCSGTKYDNKILVIVSEITDIARWYTMNILLQPMNACNNKTSCKVMPINTQFLNSVNSILLA